MFGVVLKGLYMCDSLNEIKGKEEQINKVLNNDVYQYTQLVEAVYTNINQNMIQVVSQTVSNLVSCVDNVLSEIVCTVQKVISQILQPLQDYDDVFKRLFFLEIADEIGFAIYMEMDSELQDKLIYSYRKNNNKCNKKEMIAIILDYYNDYYIDCILNSIKNVQIFNSDRVILIEDGIMAYQSGFYASSASLFAVQLSGMISDVYKEMNTIHRFSKQEKQELIAEFQQNCKPDSEKGMLLQVISYQTNGVFMWYKVLQYFLNIIYSTNENMAEYPQRHMICHGKQTNYNTKEMNLKLILCMDIISELAWRIRKMREECLIVDADIL